MRISAHCAPPLAQLEPDSSIRKRLRGYKIVPIRPHLPSNQRLQSEINNILNGNEEPTRPTQREVIDVVVRLLELLERAESGKVTAPDEDNRESPDIDALVEIGERAFAIEHTRIEQFEEAAKEQAFVDRHKAALDDVRTALQARLPRGWYELQIHGPISGPEKLLPRLFAKLVDEVVQVAGQLVDPSSPGTNIRAGKVTLNRGRIDYRVVRSFDPADGPNPVLRLAVLRRFPGNDEREARRAVVGRLLAGKCAKLARYRDEGCTTVLVLEDTALMATPHPLLLLAGAEVRNHYAEMTDILVAVSCESDIWDLQCIRTGDPLSRDLFKTNWWIWDPVEHRLIQRPSDNGSRAAIYAARRQSASDK